ncbi:hypothetical protein [Aquimarina sp. 2304DJ70-9]|uniref:hypothetical protein n=1 Tax=Aquimarina penaris TaxID=3231044 RepID=UPI003461E4B7
MKYFTLILSLLTLLLFSSCKDDDNDAFDFTGTWKLTKVTIVNSSTGTNDISITSELDVNESCLVNEFLIIQPDGTATLTSGSTLKVTLQLIEGTDNEFEQQIDCTQIESNAMYTWATGDYSITDADGSVTTFSSGGYNSIRLLDENNEIYISGFATPGNTSTMSLLINDNSSENQTVEVNGETIEITEFRGFAFQKQ